MLHGIKSVLVGADHLGPDADRKLLAVAAVYLLPGTQRRGLGIHHEAVKIENQGPQHAERVRSRLLRDSAQVLPWPAVNRHIMPFVRVAPTRATEMRPADTVHRGAGD